MSAPSTPPPVTKRFSFRSPTRAFTLTTPARPASPTTTGPNGRTTPSRSNSTRDSSSPSTASKTRSILTSAFTPRKSGLGSSATPSSDAVHEVAPKTDEPVAVETGEPAKDEPKEAAPAEHTPGHVRARSGSTISTRSSQAVPLTPPPPTQAAEPTAIPKADPVSDSPHDGASLASSRSPGRLRRQISNLSRRSGSIRRLSLLGPGATSPPAVETTAAVGEMETRSRSPSISDMRRLAGSPEPVPTTSAEPVTSDPDVIAKSPEPVASEPAEPAPQPAAPVEAPQAAATEAPVEAPVEALVAAPVEAPAAATVETSAPAPVEVAAPVETQQEAPTPAEPQTPSKLKPSTSRNASTASLTKSPGSAEKPEPKRRSTLTNWARRSLDRKPSGNGATFARPPSRGALSGDDSDNDSLKERERGWNTGRAVPSVPEPKKSDDNLKRRFSLGRRSSHAKTPNDSASESDKKTNWTDKVKVLRMGSKSKKDKGDGASSTTDVAGTDAAPEPLSIPESRPSLSIPDNMAMDQRPLSAIVESPISPAPLQTAALLVAGPSPLANTVTATSDSPVDVKPEDVHSEPEIVEAPVEAPAEPALEPTVAALVTPEPLPSDANPVEAAPVEPAPATEEVQAEVAVEVQPEATEEVQPKDASGTATPAQIETNGTAAPPENALSPMSPNSPSSTPWDPASQREIARARSPRRSAGGPSNRSRVPSPAPSIIGVKRKQPDEPEIVKSRVRYLPDWAISPAIQLAVTLSLVLPRRRRDAANPSNRRRGWWPLKRSGPRTELRYNAIRGVNEEVPVVSRSWTVPAVVRTTAKVVTAPARWMFHLFVPRSSAN
ncbi:hypothetical protein FRC08_009703 [Ceratobasidium sp. 394]|nr:hypothetical protein FRC08_009703 [Ceratobasidium sp. 394]